LNIEDLLGGLGGGSFGGFGASSGQQQVRGQDVESELTVELEDVFHGRTRAVQLSGPEGTKRYEVKIPRGIRSAEKIRLGGQGLNGHQGPRGDLYLTINIAPHRLFGVEGDDLVVEVPVAPWDAALGAKVSVPTLDGDVSMRLPAGVSSSQRLRLRGKGLPRRSGGAGDLFAKIKIVVPKKLSREQRRLFTELREASR
jgi:curved DNA-binding protein